ncbi:TrbC/VirB2 family protein [Bartonella taylorii]|uniref:TrbC/VirB2 family protein n=1 Tax=Bartonella taylorii TaxID=33046 RepID=UPI001ABA7394
MSNAKKALDALQTDLIDNIIPIAATVILLCLAIGYAGRYIGRDTFVRWAFGGAIVASATDFTIKWFALIEFTFKISIIRNIFYFKVLVIRL